MLAVNKYDKAYVDSFRAQLDAQLIAHERLAAAVREAQGGDLPAAFAEFDEVFFPNLVLVLEHAFVHRTRAVELKDGNPMNEVRMLAASILTGVGVLTADNSIKYRPEKAVLGLSIGDRIVIDVAGFRRLADAFFADLEAKFT